MPWGASSRPAARGAGQQVMVENVGGAGGMTASARVAKAMPDGYQFVLGNFGTHAQNQSLFKNPALQRGHRLHAGRAGRGAADRADDAQGPAGQQPAGVHRLRESEPGKMQYGSAGAGSAVASRLRAAQRREQHQHHARSLSRRRAGDPGPDRRPDRLSVRQCRRRRSRRSRASWSSRSRSCRATARRSCRRCHRARAGHERFRAVLWYALFLPKGTPAPIVQKLHDATVATMDSPAIING